MFIHISLSLSIYIYIYIYIHIYIYIYIYNPPWINKPLTLIKSRPGRKLINSNKTYQTTQILKIMTPKIV